MGNIWAIWEAQEPELGRQAAFPDPAQLPPPDTPRPPPLRLRFKPPLRLRRRYDLLDAIAFLVILSLRLGIFTTNEIQHPPFKPAPQDPDLG